MKEIRAYFKASRKEAVLEALHQIEGLTGVSFFKVAEGYGRDRDADVVRISNKPFDFTPHVKLELVCSDELASEVVGAIQKAAHTGLREDGKIYVSSVEEAVRISSNKYGEESV